MSEVAKLKSWVDRDFKAIKALLTRLRNDVDNGTESPASTELRIKRITDDMDDMQRSYSEASS